jgi:hypothetical protein
VADVPSGPSLDSTPHYAKLYRPRGRFRYKYTDILSVWEIGGTAPSFMASAIERGEWGQVHGPGTHWIGGWVGPRAGLDDVERRRILQRQGFVPRPVDLLTQLHSKRTSSRETPTPTPSILCCSIIVFLLVRFPQSVGYLLTIWRASCNLLFRAAALHLGSGS